MYVDIMKWEKLLSIFVAIFLLFIGQFVHPAWVEVIGEKKGGVIVRTKVMQAKVTTKKTWMLHHIFMYSDGVILAAD